MNEDTAGQCLEQLIDTLTRLQKEIKEAKEQFKKSPFYLRKD